MGGGDQFSQGKRGKQTQATTKELANGGDYQRARNWLRGMNEWEGGATLDDRKGVRFATNRKERGRIHKENHGEGRGVKNLK